MLTFVEPARAPSNPPSEIVRVQQHLLKAEQRARAERTLQLSRQQQLVRALLLDELAHYRQRGQFPHNRDSADSAPHFVDHAGRRCALAHLLDVAGEGALVQRIAAERNHARVRELANEPRLRAWLCAAGLTLAEAAAIQPDYCRTSADAICSDRSAIAGDSALPAAEAVLEATVHTVDSGSYGLSTVEVVAIHGPANDAYHVGQITDAWIDRGDGVLVEGATVLIPVQSAAPSDASVRLSGIMLSERSTYRSRSAERVSEVAPLSAQQYIDVMRSTDCFAALETIDARWTRRSSSSGDAMCATNPAADRVPTTLGILRVLVATLAARSRSTHS